MSRAIIVGMALLSATGAASAQTWLRARGGADGAGFADTTSAPATAKADHPITLNGPFAPGAGPVIGRNNKAYIGALGGRLIVVTPTTTPSAVETPLPGAQTILASPLVGADDGVYVVGVAGAVSDHRTGANPDPYFRATLNKFDKDGAFLWSRPFPTQESKGDWSDQGIVAGQLDAATLGGGELILATVRVERPKRRLALVAFTPAGDLAFSVPVGDIDSGRPVERCWFGFNCWFGNNEVTLQAFGGINALPPRTAIAKESVVVRADGVIVVTDGGHARFGYVRSTPDVTRSFWQRDDRNHSTPVSVLADGRAVVGLEDGRIALSGPTGASVATFPSSNGDPRASFAAPATRLPNDDYLMTSASGEFLHVTGATIDKRVPLAADTVVQPAASRSYIYVSTASELDTFDAGTLETVARFPWIGGGLSTPAIGSNGRVIALAGNVLHIFQNGTVNAGPLVHDHRGHPVRGTSPRTNGSPRPRVEDNRTPKG